MNQVPDYHLLIIDTKQTSMSMLSTDCHCCPIGNSIIQEQTFHCDTEEGGAGSNTFIKTNQSQFMKANIMKAFL